MNGRPNSPGELETESRDAVYIEISDLDYEWEKVPPEEAERLIQEIRRRLPKPPTDPQPPTS